MAHSLLERRRSGVLLHPTSLPGPYGAGDLGASARAFVDFLSSAKQTLWQMLPVGPVGYGNSPYSAESSFAGSPLLVDLDALVDRGLVDRKALHTIDGRADRVDYARANQFKERVRRAAFASFRGAGAADRASHDAFRHSARAWLDDYALFRALKRAHGDRAWVAWEAVVRDRDPSALNRARDELADEIDFTVFEQWLFDEDWRRMRRYAASKGVALIGDVPIFVAHDSADVWTHRDLFMLDAEGNPTKVAGVPPDYFSATGQRWGNPLYRWKRIAKTGFDFWIRRMRQALARFDAVRIDHFIGMKRAWEVPASEPTAMKGRWIKVPGKELFAALQRELGSLPFIAEDLGAVTKGVLRLRDELRLPGIKILQFAFGTDPQAPSFLPHAYPRRAVVHTGTHDNDTAVGWFESAPESERAALLRYVGGDGVDVHWDMIRVAMMSVANISIFPAQDILGLGNDARMNLPGTSERNWEWRLTEGALNDAIARRLAGLTETYGRCAP